MSTKIIDIYESVYIEIFSDDQINELIDATGQPTEEIEALLYAATESINRNLQPVFLKELDRIRQALEIRPKDQKVSEAFEKEDFLQKISEVLSSGKFADSVCEPNIIREDIKIALAKFKKGTNVSLEELHKKTIAPLEFLRDTGLSWKLLIDLSSTPNARSILCPSAVLMIEALSYGRLKEADFRMQIQDRIKIHDELFKNIRIKIEAQPQP